MIRQDGKFEIVTNKSALLQIREAMGMSRKEFATYMYANSDTIGNWENGKTRCWLSISQIKKLDLILKELGLTWQDIPDDVADPSKPKKKYKRTKNIS